MQLSKQSWYVRYYFWSASIWERFKTGYWYDSDKDRTNLCFFMRVMLVWAPLVIVLHVVTYALCVFALAVVPIYFFGTTKFLAATGALVVLCGIILLLAAVQRYREKLANARWDRERETRQFEEKYERRFGQPPISKQPKPPAFSEVVFAWIKANKAKICPSIELRA